MHKYAKYALFMNFFPPKTTFRSYFLRDDWHWLTERQKTPNIA